MTSMDPLTLSRAEWISIPPSVTDVSNPSGMHAVRDPEEISLHLLLSMSMASGTRKSSGELMRAIPM
ncbi:MAG: hypothetical protein BWZ01_03110 [Deltaproteobacteria bacterium ADurb.BinA179]|nr:MAG: hypothetical protein BWZ01_03110 [Deltaproteobacteria bacterium ADurb.BinA179]OQC22436.1 MAG: hypothetical protein BWX71_02442 [Deltaproteobacteria bacterium ADurb.Bin072]